MRKIKAFIIKSWFLYSKIQQPKIKDGGYY